MIFIGLLTHQQKQAGYFVSQDEDFIWIMHGRNSNAVCIAIFLLADAKVIDIRERTQAHMEDKELPE